MSLVRFTALLMVTAGAATAAAPVKPGEPAAAAHIRATLAARFPEVQVDAVRVAPIAGLFEVYTKGEMVYVDARAEYLLAGKLLTTADRRNLSAERWDEYNRIDFGTLPLDAAIKTVRGKGTRRLAVFSDPFCPFCRKLEQELATLQDVTIYTFLFPLEDLHKGATTRARAIWCAGDRAEAWRAWMIDSKEPAGPQCAMDPVAGNQALGGRLNVTSTPTIFFADGSRMTGALPAADLDKLLAKRAATGGLPGAASR